MTFYSNVQKVAPPLIYINKTISTVAQPFDNTYTLIDIALQSDSIDFSFACFKCMPSELILSLIFIDLVYMY